MCPNLYDLFEKNNMRNIPTITKNLLIINVLAFLAYYVFKMRGINFNDIFGLHFFLASDFHLYQLFTYMFMHAGFEHLFFNMLALWMFGGVIERMLGTKRFLTLYFACGIGAGVLQELAQYVSYMVQGLGAYDLVDTGMGTMPTGQFLNLWTTVGASGAIYGILLAFGMMLPNERIFIFPIPIPIKAKWFVMFYAVVELVSAMAMPGDNVAHFAHLGGMLFAFLLLRYWRNHGGGGYGGFGYKQSIFDKMKNMLKNRRDSYRPFSRNEHTDSRQSDWDYNKQKAEEQKEIDRLLDKIRKSGYESLTKEEKQRLFDASKK